MGRIVELSPHVANQIAAGEVVERPASVIKELVENAIDARARSIEVRIKEGGFSHIVVMDDGVGMEEADVLLATKRYATSKLETISDLNNLQTFGFRGEALPSIASISQMAIISRMQANDLGVKALLDAGTMRDMHSVQTPVGTRMEVRDLFFNVPARLKFARSRRSEVGEIDRLLCAFAFVYQDISWKFFSDNQLVFSLAKSDGDDDFRHALTLLGQDTAGHLFSIDQSSDLMSIKGVVASPAVIRKDSRGMVFFVNHRLVSDRKLIMAVKTAFQGVLEVGRHPICALNIVVPPDMVDVNVHPRKAEVRFANERAVIAHLISGLSEFLSRTPWLSSHVPVSVSTEPVQMTAVAPMAYRQDYFRRPKLDGNVRTNLNVLLGGDTQPRAHHVPLPLKPRFSELKIIGQAGSCYLITESESGLVIIDQHAAHERVMYEKIRREQAQRKSQPLLIPVSVALDSREMGLLHEYADELHKLGFEVEIFGEESGVIRALPDFLIDADHAQLLKDILHDLADFGHANAADSLFTYVCATLACHGSIRSGQRLSNEEISALLRELDGTDFHAHCPHGRPIVKSFPRGEIKKWFDRP